MEKRKEKGKGNLEKGRSRGIRQRRENNGRSVFFFSVDALSCFSESWCVLRVACSSLFGWFSWNSCRRSSFSRLYPQSFSPLLLLMVGTPLAFQRVLKLIFFLFCFCLVFRVFLIVSALVSASDRRAGGGEGPPRRDAADGGHQQGHRVRQLAQIAGGGALPFLALRCLALPCLAAHTSDPVAFTAITPHHLSVSCRERRQHSTRVRDCSFMGMASIGYEYIMRGGLGGAYVYVACLSHAYVYY